MSMETTTVLSIARDLVGHPINVGEFERAFAVVPGIDWVEIRPDDSGGVAVAYSMLDGSSGRVEISGVSTIQALMMDARTTVTARIVAAANYGLAPRDIAKLVGWQTESVSSLLSRARADGQVIRRHPAGRPKTRVGRRAGGKDAG